MSISASWIWRKHKGISYNDIIIARKEYVLSGELKKVLISVTADSFYRLVINGQWICDGPARGWPEHYYYDQIDISSYLKPGSNEIRIIACYYGVGHFHGIPQQPGLLAQIDIDYPDNRSERIMTDTSWQVARASGWYSNTPKISCQMSPAEFYNAANEDNLTFENAVIVCDSSEDRWQDLQLRDVKMLTRNPVRFKQFLRANCLEKYMTQSYCLPWAKHLYPGVIQANRHLMPAFGLITVIEVDTDINLSIDVTDHRKGDFNVSVNGQRVSSQATLQAGRHLLFISHGLSLNHITDATVNLQTEGVYRLVNPYQSDSDNPWTMLAFESFKCAETDLQCQGYSTQFQACMDGYAKMMERLGGISEVGTFVAETSEYARNISFEDMFAEDRYCRFINREEIPGAEPSIQFPENILKDSNGTVTILPSEAGDVELIYDLGEQNIGYWSFALESEQGVEVDIYAVEYITPKGKIQLPDDHRNGMTYVTKAGLNTFTSLKRRSGRYLFIRFNSQTQPVKLKCFELIESTYPVEHKGAFECSDSKLNQIWDISARTLKLCMEDAFTDCPLYEQTLWVGDARNESLFAYGVFGATDIAKRCIQLAAQSLERFEMVGSQVPSSWHCILPAWSFLWGISVWDCYWYTGNEAFLEKMWPAVYRNLKGASNYIDSEGLFSADFWNFFDWAGIDQDHPTVLHNSMFMIGAIDAAIQCGRILGYEEQIEEFQQIRATLKNGINRLWNEAKQTYPDSIHRNGTVSSSICQHTSFLALLYDIGEQDKVDTLIQNVLHPSDETVKVGSPFAMLYLYEMLEKYGRSDVILKSIYESYLPMLKAGATTVWESFNIGTLGSDEFPTRSHCHGWSSAPLYFLPRTILGIRPTSPGCESFEISPYLAGLEWARGTYVTPKGLLEVSWQKQGDQVNISYSAPQGIEICFKVNEMCAGYTIHCQRDGRGND